MNDNYEKVPIPDWKLERYVLGELPTEEIQFIKQKIELDADLRFRFSELIKLHSELDSAHPSGLMVKAIREKLGQKKTASRTWNVNIRLLVPVMGVLALLLILPTGIRNQRNISGFGSSITDETRLKGIGPQLFLYRKSGKNSQSLVSGELVKAGDLVQVLYNAAGRQYGAIVSVDSRNQVSYHLSGTGNTAVLLKQDAPVSLEHSFELDATPGQEIFYFITSHKPFDIDSVLVLLKDIDSSQNTESLQVTSFTLNKESVK